MAQHDADVRYQMYEYLAQRKFEAPANGTGLKHENAATPNPVPVETTK
jgi:hypothetical protein